MTDDSDLEKYERKVEVRCLRVSDYPAVLKLQKEVFKTINPWTRPQFLGQLRSFPEGQIGVEVEGELVANSSSLLISGHVASSVHDFDTITDEGLSAITVKKVIICTVSILPSPRNIRDINWHVGFMRPARNSSWP